MLRFSCQRLIRVGILHFHIYKKSRFFVFSASFLSHLLLPRQEVSPCTNRSFIEHPVFFTRNSLCFVSRSTLRGKPIPRLIGLTESQNNLKSGRSKVLFGNFESNPKPPLIFQRIWKRNFTAKEEAVFRREKEENSASYQKNPRSQLSQFSLLNQLL